MGFRVWGLGFKVLDASELLLRALSMLLLLRAIRNFALASLACLLWAFGLAQDFLESLNSFRAQMWVEGFGF